MKRGKPVGYIVGRYYDIAPFGKSDIVKDSIGQAKFIGYIKKADGYPSKSTVEWPVFEAPHYGQTILYALDGGLCSARGATIELLMQDFAKAHQFWGEHKIIKVEWNTETRLDKDEFLRQMLDCGVKTSDLAYDLESGQYHTKQVEYGDVKWCPKCTKMRKTTCCACGCGNCKTCGHRWVCCSPAPVTQTGIDLSKLITGQLK